MGYGEKNQAQLSGVRRQGEECAAAIALGEDGAKKNQYHPGPKGGVHWLV